MIDDYKKSFGILSQHSSRPFPYSKRVNDASKVATKKKKKKKKKKELLKIIRFNKT